VSEPLIEMVPARAGAGAARTIPAPANIREIVFDTVNLVCMKLLLADIFGSQSVDSVTTSKLFPAGCH
jgi:hypothetical protein